MVGRNGKEQIGNGPGASRKALGQWADLQVCIVESFIKQTNQIAYEASTFLRYLTGVQLP